MKYSEGFRASIVRKTQDGSGRTVYQVARRIGMDIKCLTAGCFKAMGGRKEG